MVQILDPQVLVVGGGVIDAGDLLLTPARAAFAGGAAAARRSSRSPRSWRLDGQHGGRRRRRRPGPPPLMAVRSVRVVSYNVHGLDDDRGALDAVVRTLAPDVVFVQEAPRRFRWRTRCAEMAHSLGMIYAAGGLPSLGNVIVTSHRVRVHETWCLRYPLTPGRHMRGAAFARCSVGGCRSGRRARIWPPMTPSGRRQAQLLDRGVDGVAEPVMFGGDLNETAAGASWQLLADGLIDVGAASDVPTFPVDEPEAADRRDHRRSATSRSSRSG